MLVKVTAEFECDKCGKRKSFDIDHASTMPAEWSIFELALDVTRWEGSGRVLADGRWWCDACDQGKGGAS